MLKNIREKKGITLIALVVTIIVLIILAGISINLVLGENGIIKKAGEAKEATEQAQLNEEIATNELMDQWETLVGESSTGTPPIVKSEIEQYRDSGEYMTKLTDIKDSNGNIIKVPEGFKIATDSGINVTEGIVIEDKDIKEGIGNNRGNQYVWIPVGENIKKSDGTTVNITLGRYVFADGTNHKDDKGNALQIGTPIIKQSAENYGDETEINIKEIKPTEAENHVFKELKINRPGVASSGLDSENTTALDLKGFVDSVKSNGGYYIARYEASYGVDGKANSKVSNTFTNEDTAPTTREEGMLWNHITQIDSTTASRNLYTTIKSDLINSYAWDTAIVYIQELSEDKDYSYQDGKSINSSLTNTGVNVDEVCKINDMAANMAEWTTEYSTYTISSLAYTCTGRGGYYDSSVDYTSTRRNIYSTYSDWNGGFRSILYM